jgi:WD40 repeat protein
MIWKHQVGYADDDHVYIQESSPKSLQDDLFIPNCTETDRVDDCVVSNEMATLVHAQGYQSNFIGQSVFYDCNGRVIYPASNLLVSCDPKTSSQRFFEQHETISAICTSGDKQLVASASNNSIRIWDTSTHQAISLLPLPVEGKISFLTFSPDNNKIASISRDDHGNYTSIYATLTGNWIDGFLESTSLAGHNHVYFALFTCFDSRPNYFVVGGSSHLNFWTHHQSSLVPSHQHVEDVHICGVQIGENVVTGTKSGRLVFWNDKKISGEVNAHERSVLALCRCPEGLLSASSDGMVIMWCNGRKKLGSFDVSTSFESPYQKALCSLDAFPSITGERTAKILVGTRSSKIYEVSCTTGCITAVTDFHEYGDVRAASFDPNNQDQFATVGSDNFIKIWSLQNNQVVAQAQVSKFPLRCVDWSNNGMILVGCDTKNEKSGVPYTVSWVKCFGMYNALNRITLTTIFS